MNELVFLTGIVGGGIIIAAWLLETRQAIAKHKGLDLGFSVFSFIGVFLLLIYSILISDVIFILLNASIATLIAIEIAVTLRSRKRSSS
jgi:lipid-A-disaccharide synthase-like uncharacterized protein